MRILGIGTDIIECARIGRMVERHGEEFLKRVYTERELGYCQGHRDPVERYAGRWAAKEAILKAIGTGWRNGISWLDVEVYNQSSGLPSAHVSGVAREHAEALGIRQVQISISHCKSHAVAFAIALGTGGPGKPLEDLFSGNPVVDDS